VFGNSEVNLEITYDGGINLSSPAGYYTGTPQWAFENGCDWDASTCAVAAKNGHLDVLQWAFENGCPWDASTCAAAATTL
jgi:hypothetical protein